MVGKDAKRFAKALKGFQTALGEHQDTVVAREALRELGAQAHAAGENGFSFGVLHARDAALAARIEERLPASGRRLESPQPPVAATNPSRPGDRGRSGTRAGRVRRSGGERRKRVRTRDAVADLRRIAFLLERAHESTYRVRAFRTAAAVLGRRAARRAGRAGPHRGAGPAAKGSAR